MPIVTPIIFFRRAQPPLTRHMPAAVAWLVMADRLRPDGRHAEVMIPSWWGRFWRAGGVREGPIAFSRLRAARVARDGPDTAQGGLRRYRTED